MTLERDEIVVRTRDGEARAWIHGGGDGRRPAIVMYPDAYGVRPALHEMADRLAALGYVVMLPDVFYRAGVIPPFDIATAWTVPAERERIMGLLGSLTQDRVEMDGASWLDALAARDDVRSDRVGATGYCMGGRLAYLTAAFHPARVRAAASFHGGGLVTDQPDSPHRLAERVRASLYFGVADSDRSCTPEQQGTLATALAAAHLEYRIELYSGKKHGFAVTDHAGAYDRDASERHWKRMQELFAETLLIP